MSKIHGVNQILENTISNGQISTDADIADTKLATISTSGKVALSALGNDASVEIAPNTLPVRDANGNLRDIVDATVAMVVGESLGSGDDEQVIFEVSAGKYITGSLEVMLNGLAQERGVNFTESSPTTGAFTFAVAPCADEKVTVNYNNKGNFVYGQLDVDTLDGRPAGNESGNIPINNGTLNVDLNAQKLNGLTSADFASADHDHDDDYEPLNSNIQGHISSTSNPHSVDAADVGAPALVSTSVANNFVSFNNTAGAQKDSGVSAASFAVSNHNHSGVYATLTDGKIPNEQLPNAVMEYKGTWSASANSPALSNGMVGASGGDVYRVTSVGTVNFGAGNVSFVIGDYVIYTGTVWEKSGASSLALGTASPAANGVASAGVALDASREDHVHPTDTSREPTITTLAVNKGGTGAATATANYVFAAPNGTAGAPAFRAVVAADIPTLNQSTTGNAATATYASAVTLTADNSTNSTEYPLFSSTTTGNVSPRTDSGLTYNPSSGTLTSSEFAGHLTGNVTGTASQAAQAYVFNNTGATQIYPVLSTGTGAYCPLQGSSAFYFVPSTGVLHATTFTGNLTGTVTGNATNVTGTVAVANGGTGATAAAAARTNLGVGFRAIGGSYLGTPNANSFIFFDVTSVAYSLPTNCTGSYFKCMTNPTTNIVFALLKNGSNIGTVTIATTGVATWSVAGNPTTFAVGDVLKIYTPAALNGIANLVWLFHGTY